MPNLLTTFLPLLAIANLISCDQQGLEVVQMARAGVQNAMDWARAYSSPLGSGQDLNNFYVGVALGDCVKLYEDTEPRLERLVSGDQEYCTRDDAVTWLSGAVASHRSCLDGLEEKGSLFASNGGGEVARNLTVLLGEALAFYGSNKTDLGNKSNGRQKRPNRNPGGLLAAWNAATSKADLVVAQDGSGSHKTINEAVAAVGRMGRRRPERVVIHVRAGVYNERVEIGRNLRHLMFVGDGMDKTIVTGSRNVVDGATTLSSATFGNSYSLMDRFDGRWNRCGRILLIMRSMRQTCTSSVPQVCGIEASSGRSCFLVCKHYLDSVNVVLVAANCHKSNSPRENHAVIDVGICIDKVLFLTSTQDCFKSSWSTHKSVHLKEKLSALGLGAPGEQNSASPNDGWLYCLKKGQARTPKLPHFDWTGSLRPYPISRRRAVPADINQPDWAIDGIPKIEPNSDLQHVVEIKTPELIDRMREACRIAREVLDAAARVVRPGVTTDEIDDVVHEATIAAGGYPSPLNYHFFPKSCCTSINEVICHGIPDARKLEDGDIVNVDVTVYYKGVHGDLNETFFVGNVDEASRQLVQCTYECLEKAIAIVKPGVRFREIGEVINRHASMAGFSVVKSICGHGIGELFHCAPNIPHYARNKAVGVMKAGQTYTIEPMINAGVWRDRMWPDGWTAVTADGKRSAQFEHTLLEKKTETETLPDQASSAWRSSARRGTIWGAGGHRSTLVTEASTATSLARARALTWTASIATTVKTSVAEHTATTTMRITVVFPAGRGWGGDGRGGEGGDGGIGGGGGRGRGIGGGGRGGGGGGAEEEEEGFGGEEEGWHWKGGGGGGGERECSASKGGMG
ncbi:hypothetical protein RHGRI_019241 [Rhododendron griersonianum]|uniref:Methionine aminopeptidase n=1 Tax=Rhododendron griersonianum TaxID=479676 RepID=A0AAV6JBV8_9ERIC|nr:hypothetical protein RHGRI_019241 [Rhododendron griersonianum]